MAVYNVRQQNFSGGIVDESLDVRDNLELYQKSASQLRNVSIGNAGGLVVRPGVDVTDEVPPESKSISVKVTGDDGTERVAIAGVVLDPDTNTYGIEIHIYTGSTKTASYKVWDSGSNDADNVKLQDNRVTHLIPFGDIIFFKSDAEPCNFRGTETGKDKYEVKLTAIDILGNRNDKAFTFDGYTFEELTALFKPGNTRSDPGVTGSFDVGSTFKFKNGLYLNFQGNYSTTRIGSGTRPTGRYQWGGREIYESYSYSYSVTNSYRMTFTNVNTGDESSITYKGEPPEVSTNSIKGMTEVNQDYTIREIQISSGNPSTGTHTVDVSAKGTSGTANWSTTLPRIISHYQNRLLMSGFDGFPNAFMFSRSNDPFNFSKNPKKERLVDSDTTTAGKTTSTVKYVDSTSPFKELYDDSGVQFALVQEETPIIYSALSNIRDLFIFTSVGIWVHSGSDGVIKPNNFSFEKNMSIRCHPTIQPVSIDESVCFVDAENSLQLARYDDVKQNYIPTNISRLAKVSIGEITQIKADDVGTYRRLYVLDNRSFRLKDDYIGTSNVFVLHLNQEQKVMAWTHFDYQGLSDKWDYGIENIEVINGNLTIKANRLEDNDAIRSSLWVSNPDSDEKVDFTVDTLPIRLPENVRDMNLIEGDPFRIFDVRINITNADNLNVNGYNVPMKLGSNILGVTPERDEIARILMLGTSQYGRGSVLLSGTSKGGQPAEIKSITSLVEY